jgi:non-specific serine/threonine protein kinase
VEEGLALHRRIGDERAVAVDLAVLGAVADTVGDYERARTVLEDAIPALERWGDRHLATLARYALALAAYGQGDLERAAAGLEEVVATSQAAGDLHHVALALTSLGLVRTDRGEHARAARCLREGLPAVRQIGTTERLAGWLACAATLAAERQLPTAAARLFGAAEPVREAVGSQYAYPGRTRFEQAQARVRRELGEAAFGAAWAEGAALAIDDALAEAMVVVEDPNPSVPLASSDPITTLTRRQRDVLRYLVEGATDREIARALSISPHTVGHHVSAILAKLGVETRRGARAYAARRPLPTSNGPR